MHGKTLTDIGRGHDKLMKVGKAKGLRFITVEIPEVSVESDIKMGDRIHYKRGSSREYIDQLCENHVFVDGFG